MKDRILSDLGGAGAKLTPVGVVKVAADAGWGVQEWMYAATIVYVFLQAAYLIWKWRREASRREGA